LSVCVGAVPVIVAAAVPLATVPIARLLAGPVAPAGPCGPTPPGVPVGESVTLTTSPLVAVTLVPAFPVTVTAIAIRGSSP
jgi:hypothetical protein